MSKALTEEAIKSLEPIWDKIEELFDAETDPEMRLKILAVKMSVSSRYIELYRKYLELRKKENAEDIKIFAKPHHECFFEEKEACHRQQEKLLKEEEELKQLTELLKDQDSRRYADIQARIKTQPILKRMDAQQKEEKQQADRKKQVKDAQLSTWGGWFRCNVLNQKDWQKTM